MTIKFQTNRYSGLKPAHIQHSIELALQKNRDYHIIGETTVDKIKGGSIVPIKAYIVKGANQPDYRLIDNKNNELGFTTLHFYHPCKEKVYGVDYKYERFPGAVYIENMESLYDNYRGVGNVLHEVAVRIAQQEEYKGRVLLDAEKSSHIFHYKFGFRSMGEEHYLKDEAIENEIEKAQRKSSTKEHDTSHLGPIPMYLPEETIQEILNREQITLYSTKAGTTRRSKKVIS